MPESDVAASIRFWRSQTMAVWGHFLLLPIEIFFLWGLNDWRACLAWSAVACAYSAWVYLRGWTPWRMPAYEMYVGHEGPKSLSGAADAIVGLLHSPRLRCRGALIVATAGITPWLGLLASQALQLRPLGVKHDILPVWVYAVFGLVDAIRASTIAMNYWLTQVERSGLLSPDDRRPGVPAFGSLRWFLKDRRMSMWQFVTWSALGIAAAILVRAIVIRILR